MRTKTGSKYNGPTVSLLSYCQVYCHFDRRQLLSWSSPFGAILRFDSYVSCQLLSLSHPFDSKVNNQTDYLDLRWQKFRLKRLQLANWRCESCSSTSTLHIHHKRYIRGRKPWEYSMSDTKVLCDDCHKQVHGIEPNPNLAEFLATFPKEHPNAHYHDMPDDPDENNEFEEWIYFENGKMITKRRPNPKFRRCRH
jgi:hypothetical protein